MDRFEILDAIQEVVYVTDMDTYEIIYVNKKGRNMLGMSLEEIQHKKCYKVFQNRDNKCDFCTNDQLRQEGAVTWTHKNEEFHSIDMLHDSLLEIDGKKYRIELAVDISKIKADALMIKNSLEKEKRLGECIQKLVITKNFEKSVQIVLERILSYYDGDRAYIFEFDWENHVVSNTFETCMDGVTSEIDSLQDVNMDVVALWIQLFKEKDIVNIEDINKIIEDPKRKDEYELLHRQNISSLFAVPFWYDGVLQGFLGVDNPKIHLSDIQFMEQLSFFITNEIEKNKLTLKLKQLSYQDILTGCFNRNAYNEQLENLKNWKNFYDSVGILFVDMNGLKHVNDTYGHTYGDNMIRKLAQIMFEYFNNMQIYRISGDEFVIVDLNTDYQDFTAKAGALHNRFLIEEKNLAAVGYVWENGDVELSVLVQQAELQMYTQKKEYYAKTGKASRKHRPEYMDQLLQDMSEGDYLVYLQPKCDVVNREIIAAEALVRKRDKDGKIIVPYEFIHILEKENMISAVDFFVFEQVCNLLVSWKKEGRKKMIISTNFSRITFAENDFVDHILDICDRTGVDCSQLVLEITESSNAVRVEQMSDTMQKLKARGLRFALDDVGTEYSTLEMFTLPEIDIEKLDRSLIMRIANSKRDRVLVEKLVELGHTLGMICIAEGVETEEQFDILRDIGCDRIQGYLLGKPMPIEEFQERFLM